MTSGEGMRCGSAEVPSVTTPNASGRTSGAEKVSNCT